MHLFLEMNRCASGRLGLAAWLGSQFTVEAACPHLPKFTYGS
jgi:hypothetical protein